MKRQRCGEATDTLEDATQCQESNSSSHVGFSGASGKLEVAQNDFKNTRLLNLKIFNSQKDVSERKESSNSTLTSRNISAAPLAIQSQNIETKSVTCSKAQHSSLNISQETKDGEVD